MNRYKPLKPLKCPYCGCKRIVREQGELRCDDCDMIIDEE